MRIGICGYGFVGQAVAAGFQSVAELVLIDPKLNNNKTIEDLSEAMFVFVCVPTPMCRTTKEIDSSIVEQVCAEIYDLYRGMADFSTCPIVIVKSTTTPDALERIQRNNPGIRLVMNPEFLVERTAVEDFKNQSRIVIGGQANDVFLVRKLYEKLWPDAEYYISDLKTASLVKYMNNTFLALKVSFIAEWHRLALQLDLDPEKLIEMFLGDSRVGKSHTNQPGPDGDYGFGGKCFPKDLNALVSYARSLDCPMHTLEAAWQTNQEVRKNHDWETIEGAVSDE